MNLDAFLDGSVTFTQNIMRMVFVGLAVLAGVFCVYQGLRMCVAQAQGQREGRPLFGPVVAHFMLGYMLLRLAGFSTDVIQLLFGAPPTPPARPLRSEELRVGVVTGVQTVALPIFDGSVTFTQNIMRMVFVGLAVLAGVFCVDQGLRMCVAQAQGQREGRPLFGPVVAHFMLGYMLLRLAGFSTDVIQLLFGATPTPPASAL